VGLGRHPRPCGRTHSRFRPPYPILCTPTERERESGVSCRHTCRRSWAGWPRPRRASGCAASCFFIHRRRGSSPTVRGSVWRARACVRARPGPHATWAYTDLGECAQTLATVRYVKVGCLLLELLVASPEGVRLLIESELVSQARSLPVFRSAPFRPSHGWPPQRRPDSDCTLCLRVVWCGR
jgi:hypothetical protein